MTDSLTRNSDVKAAFEIAQQLTAVWVRSGKFPVSLVHHGSSTFNRAQFIRALGMEWADWMSKNSYSGSDTLATGSMSWRDPDSAFSTKLRRALGASGLVPRPRRERFWLYMREHRHTIARRFIELAEVEAGLTLDEALDAIKLQLAFVLATGDKLTWPSTVKVPDGADYRAEKTATVYRLALLCENAPPVRIHTMTRKQSREALQLPYWGWSLPTDVVDAWNATKLRDARPRAEGAAFTGQFLKDLDPALSRAFAALNAPTTLLRETGALTYESAARALLAELEPLVVELTTIALDPARHKALDPNKVHGELLDSALLLVPDTGDDPLPTSD